MKKETQAAAAIRLTKALGFEVTRKMVRVWTAKGYPLNDVDEIRRRLRNQERAPKATQPTTAAERPEREGETEAKPLDPLEVERELAKLQARMLAAEDYETARTLRTQIAGIRDVLKELREQGKYILRDVSTSEAMQAGAASRAAWEKIEDELPPMLDGLTAAQMKVKLRDFARSRCIELAEHFA